MFGCNLPPKRQNDRDDLLTQLGLGCGDRGGRKLKSQHRKSHDETFCRRLRSGDGTVDPVRITIRPLSYPCLLYWNNLEQEIVAGY